MDRALLINARLFHKLAERFAIDQSTPEIENLIISFGNFLRWDSDECLPFFTQIRNPYWLCKIVTSHPAAFLPAIRIRPRVRPNRL
jgi:hypothetical protein